MLQSAGLMPLLHVSKISLNNIRTLSLLQFIFLKFCHYSPKTVFFEPVQVLNQSLVSTAKWHITSLVYLQGIKNYYLRQYHLFLFTDIRNVHKTKHNLIFV